MNTHYAREQLAETCRQIGADFTYDEAEGEARACIMLGLHWWSLVASTDGDDQLWYCQLQQLKQAQWH
ncbi:MAG: hypothetical protein ACRCXB_09790 [Aeromonadaceae bacterium]